MRYVKSLVFISLLGITACHAPQKAPEHTAPSAERHVLGSIPKRSGAFVLNENTLLDGATETIILATDENDVMAIDVADGRQRWRTPDLSMLLGLQGANVLGVSQKGPSRLILIDVPSGAITKQCPIPPEVSLFRYGGSGGRSTVNAVVEEKRVIITTESSSWYTGGMAPTEEMLAAAEHHTRQVLEIDLASCNNRLLANERSDGSSREKLLINDRSPHGLDTMAAPVAASDVGPLMPPSTTEKRTVTIRVQVENSKGGRSVTLLRNEAGRSLPPIVLADNMPPDARANVSVDMQHVWVSAWHGRTREHRIFDGTSGAELIRFTANLEPMQFYAASTTLITISYDSIAGTSLVNGKALWDLRMKQEKRIDEPPLP